uniref:Uncharacterized protein n=1 Tax=Arundo donax TaxID=35708 RepID=A0A0A9R7U6_ARUDO
MEHLARRVDVSGGVPGRRRQHLRRGAGFLPSRFLWGRKGEAVACAKSEMKNTWDPEGVSVNINTRLD